MWKRLCITLCFVFCATLCAVPAVFADDSSASSADSSSDSTFLGDAGELNGKVSDNFADGVDKVKDDLTDVHGSLHYNLKDEFPQCCKEALSFVPEAYWWAFSLAILFGFVLALYRRMT